LYDWDRIDATTGKTRELQVEKALACIDYAQAPSGPVTPVLESTNPVTRTGLFHCEYFRVWRLKGEFPFTVGTPGAVRVIVCIDGAGQILHNLFTYEVRRGDVFLLPAAVGACAFRPRGGVTLLEIAGPE
jgi:mannose-6-phosphate isomerase